MLNFPQKMYIQLYLLPSRTRDSKKNIIIAPKLLPSSLPRSLSAPARAFWFPPNLPNALCAKKKKKKKKENKRKKKTKEKESLSMRQSSAS